MKPKSTLRLFLLAAGSSLLAISSALAQSLTWDGNSTTAPNPNGGNGTWDTTTTNWWNGSTNVTWPSSGTNNDAEFADTLGTVSIATGGVTANDLTFNTTGYLIQSNTLTLNGTTPTITTGASVTATISSLVAGSAGLTKEGTGTLILSNGSNSYSGTTIVNAGILQWGANNALASGNLTVNSGGTVTMSTFTDTVGTITLNRGVINVTTGFNESNSLKTGSGGFITTGGTVNNWPGIGLGGNFTYNTDGGNETTATIAAIDFNGGGRTFNIADGVQAIDVNIGVSLFDDNAGNRNFTKAGTGTMQISGSSSQQNYNLGTGTTSINDGVLLLNKGTGVIGANAVGGTGLVTVGDGTGAANSAILRYVGFNDQIVSNAITINSDGLLDLANRSDTVGAVTLSGGSISSTTGVLSGTSYAVQSGAISAKLGGTGALTKTTAGTVTISSDNSTGGYSGATNVNGGKLTISSTGNINSTSGVSIGAGEFNYNASTALSKPVTFSGTGGTLSGSGTITQTVNITSGNTLAIGNSAGQMNFGGNLTVAGTYLYEVTGGGTAADLGDVTGNLTLGGILDLVQLGTYTAGNKFTLFAYDGSLSGVFKDSGGINNILDGGTFTDAGGDWTINYDDAFAGLNGGTGSLFVTITAIPEPSAALLGGIGLLLLLRRRRA